MNKEQKTDHALSVLGFQDKIKPIWSLPGSKVIKTDSAARRTSFSSKNSKQWVSKIPYHSLTRLWMTSSPFFLLLHQFIEDSAQLSKFQSVQVLDFDWTVAAPLFSF